MVDTFIACVKTAFASTKSLLWPFRGSTWVKLWLLFLLTGGGGSFFGGNTPNFSSGSGTENNVEAKKDMASPTSLGENLPFDQAMQKFLDDRIGTARQFLEKHRNTLIKTGVSLLILFLLGSLFFVWLSSRLTLVIYESLDKADVAIRQNFARTRHEGQSFFRWNLFWWSLFLGSVLYGGFRVWTAILERIPGTPIDVVPLVLSMLGGVFLVILVSILLWITNEFLPVVMLIKHTTALQTLKNSVMYALDHRANTLVVLGGYIICSMVLGFALSLVVGVLGLPLLLGGLAIGFLGKKLALTIAFSVLSFLVMLTAVSLIALPIRTFLFTLKLHLVKKLG